jgi:hypothetical protein
LEQGDSAALGVKLPAGWEELAKALRSVKTTERETLSVAQMQQVKKSLSQRLGQIAGQGPMGVEQWIKQTLLPQAKQTQAEMQHEVDMKEKEVEGCQSLMWSAEKEVEHREKVLLKDESGKYQCIAREHQLHKEEEDKCNNLLTFQSALEPPPSINNASKDPMSFKEALTLNYEFYNSGYPEFMNRKGACDDARAAAEAQLAECDADEAVIEEFYCKMKQGRDDACASYSKCYDEKLQAMNDKIEKVEKLEEKVKEEFVEMSCAGHDFSNEGSPPTSNAECDTDAYTTNHLDVTYPTAPVQGTCVSLMSTRRDYSPIECLDGEVVGGATSGGNGDGTSDGNSTGNSTT